ncbi:MAG: 3-deoxy-manno-octulosonate cytidylyltransferase [Parachlamydiaceae bacterium]|nr:3-deoxy-manno-octulosonate cytidylyltransferase [Parachlamydiaceae bacterium]
MSIIKILGIIPARYQSTRLPGKLLIPILGKTLLQRTFENAQKVTLLDHLCIATDDQRIFDHALDFNGKPIMTPDCPNGTYRLAEAIKNNQEWLNADAIVNIQGDEPCLNPEAINQTIRLLLEDPSAQMATLVTPIKSSEEAYSTSVVKCVMDLQDNALYFSRSLIPANHSMTYRPDITYYKHIGLYVYRPSFLLTLQNLKSSPLQIEEDLEQLKVLENGYRIKVAITDTDSIGVDREEDLIKVENWICR